MVKYDSDYKNINGYINSLDSIMIKYDKNINAYINSLITSFFMIIRSSIIRP